jgi:hypothetical protein
VLSQVVKSAEPPFQHPLRSPLGGFQRGGEGGWCRSGAERSGETRDQREAGPLTRFNVRCSQPSHQEAEPGAASDL